MPRDQAAADTLIEGSDDLGFLAGWGDMSYAQGLAPRRAAGREFCGSRRARHEGDSSGRIPSSFLGYPRFASAQRPAGANDFCADPDESGRLRTSERRPASKNLLPPVLDCPEIQAAEILYA
jgi:hypothetical protein